MFSTWWYLQCYSTYKRSN